MTSGSVRSLVFLSLAAVASVGACREALHSFTVTDEIGLAHFGDPYTGKAQAVQFSPNSEYFAVNTERGRLDVNRPESSLTIYRTKAVLDFLQARENTGPPAPTWAVIRSTDVEGTIIHDWRWLADSSGIAFLERGRRGIDRLVVADVNHRVVEPLSPEGGNVKAFDVRDAQHYAYVLASDAVRNRGRVESQSAAVSGTGRSLPELLFPVDYNPGMASWADRGELWAVLDGKHIQLKDPRTGEPLILFSEGQRALSLSPDGLSLITALALPEIPAAWESQYRPPFAASPYHIRPQRQDLSTFMGNRFISQYVRIDVQTNRMQSLTNAPTSGQAGWWSGGGAPQWSRDGKAILLPGTFYNDPLGSPAGRPCAAFYLEPSSNDRSCVESLTAQLRDGYEEGYHYIKDIRFERGEPSRVVVSFYNLDNSPGATEYRKGTDAHWAVVQRIRGELTAESNSQLEVSVKEDFNNSPTLVATNRENKVSRTLWDPNPQLRDIALGQVEVHIWKDAAQRSWRGGLFKPINFRYGQRYPLVIQTHGFVEQQFRPSGVFPTAMAARALAAAGLLVLQVGDDVCPINTSEEVSCAVSGYQGLVGQLQREGLIDPERVGIIGFSRTCYYVMQTLTASSLRIEAASITDGVMEDYLQFLTTVDLAGNAIPNEADAIIGAAPFGGGLESWLKRSPLFNIDRVAAPLLVVSEGRPSLLFMWAPYAALRYLNKPTELILLNTDEHVLTNPAVRLVSQGGSVDWFRFWLQGYERSTSVAESGETTESLIEQYRRWEKLCDMQAEQNPNQPSFCVRTKTH